MSDGESKRLRLMKHIDFSKAKGCKRCKGTGIIRHEKMDLPDGTKDAKVPVICRCVSRGGGVQKDAQDRILERITDELENGIFAENLANDVNKLPPADRSKAVQNLQIQSMRTDLDPKVKEALVTALGRLTADKE